MKSQFSQNISLQQQLQIKDAFQISPLLSQERTEKPPPKLPKQPSSSSSSSSSNTSCDKSTHKNVEISDQNKKNNNNNNNNNITILNKNTHSIQKQVNQQEKTSFCKQSSEFIHVIFLIILHYCDFFTDLLISYQLYQYYERDNTQYKQNILSIVLTLIFSIFYERTQLYNMCIEIQYFIKKQQHPQNHMQAELSKKEKFKIFLQVLFFVEQFNFIKMQSNKSKIVKQKTKKYIFEKRISDLYVENYLFFILGLVFLLKEYENFEVSKLALISSLFSFLSVITIQVKMYFKRFTKSYKFKRLNFTEDFDKFPIDLQLYLSNPGQIHLLKFHVNVQRYKYISYFKTENYKDETIKRPVLNWKKKLYIVVYVLIYNLSFSLLYVLMHISEKMVQNQFTLVLAYMIYIPVQVKHYKVWKKKNEKLRIKDVILKILKQPLIMVIAALSLVFPVMVQEIPFLPETKQVWVYNYIPPMINIVVLQVLQCYLFMITMNVVYYKKDHSDWFIDTEEKLDDITNPDKPFRLLINFTQILFILNFIMTFLYIFYKIRVRNKQFDDIQHYKMPQQQQNKNLDKYKKEEQAAKQINFDNKDISLKDKNSILMQSQFSLSSQKFDIDDDNHNNQDNNMQNSESQIKRNISLINKQYNFKIKDSSFSAKINNSSLNGANQSMNRSNYYKNQQIVKLKGDEIL